MDGNTYSLIFWNTHKSVSVIEESLIGGDNRENGLVSVKYGKKDFRGTVIKRSEDKDYLEELGSRVTKEGKIYPVGKKKPSKAILAEKLEIASNNKAETKVKKSVKDHRVNSLMNLMDQSNNNFTEESDNKDWETPQPEHAQGTCEYCQQFPHVTAENLVFMKEVSDYMTCQYERQLKLAVKCPKDDETKKNAAKELQIMTKTDSGYKEELERGSGVFAPKSFLSDLARDFKYRPTEMVRRLFKLLVGPAILAKSSALGEGKHKAVDSTIRKAVQGWVDRHTKGDCLSNAEFNRTINLMCGTLRNPKSQNTGEPRDRTSESGNKNTSRKRKGQDPHEKVPECSPKKAGKAQKTSVKKAKKKHVDETDQKSLPNSPTSSTRSTRDQDIWDRESSTSPIELPETLDNLDSKKPAEVASTTPDKWKVANVTAVHGATPKRLFVEVEGKNMDPSEPRGFHLPPGPQSQTQVVKVLSPRQGLLSDRQKEDAFQAGIQGDPSFRSIFAQPTKNASPHPSLSPRIDGHTGAFYNPHCYPRTPNPQRPPFPMQRYPHQQVGPYFPADSYGYATGPYGPPPPSYMPPPRRFNQPTPPGDDDSY